LRRRRGTSLTAPDSQGKDTGRNWVVWGGIALPLVVIGITFGYSTYTLAAVDQPPEAAELEVHVIGRRWWWEVIYPDYAVTTANEIHIPVGVPVRIQLESADVIHSFWVPELHGKLDLVPTRVNLITIQADAAGAYRGECAEFCGLQHAHMGFMVVAESQADFENWLAEQQAWAEAPTEPAAVQGQEVFLSAGCTFCHTVRGLDDKSVDRSGVDLGPDLTHLASRMTIAGASLTQNTGNLAGWILDPQHVKPGSLMPNTPLDADDLHALLAYLASLE
jgi:cytochrome c oxidase subunit 2